MELTEGGIFMNYAKCMRGLLLTAVMFVGTLFAIDPPQNLEATGGSESIDLNWDGVEGATFYNVYLYDEDGNGGGGECEEGFLEDCSGDGDCCAESWVGDGFCDGADQQYGCDLLCYQDDGGDCASCEDEGLVTCPDGSCAATLEDCPEVQETYPGFDCCDLDFVDCSDEAYANYVGTIVDCSDQYCLPAAELGDGVCTDYTDAGYPGVGFNCEELDNDGGDCQTCAEQGLIDCPDGSCAATLEDCPEVVCTEITDCSGAVLCNEDSVYSSYDCLTPLNCEDVNGDGQIVTWLGDGYCDDGAYGLFFNCEEWSNDCGDCDGTDLGDINGYCPEILTCEDQGLYTCPDGSCAADADSCATCEDQGLLTDCVGVCFNESQLSWIGDGYCDDGTYGVVFTCEEYNFDNGDCDGREAGSQMKFVKIKDFAASNGIEDLAPKQGAPYHTNGDIREESGYSNIACATAGASCTAGDVNEDGAINVLDIVNIVNHILATVVLEDTCAADFNEDGDVNVLDIVNIVNIILGGKTAADATEATLIQSGGSLLLKSDGYIGGIEMTLIHGEDFSLELSGNSLVSDYVTRDGQTKVVVVVPEGEVLFTATGDYTVEDVLVANSHSAVSVNQASKFELSSAYPNPFNPVTSMSFTMPQDGLASVKVYNLMGQQVALLADGNYTQGMHQLTWNASDLSSGVYIVKAIYAGNVSTQKLVLMK